MRGSVSKPPSQLDAESLECGVRSGDSPTPESWSCASLESHYRDCTAQRRRIIYLFHSLMDLRGISAKKYGCCCRPDNTTPIIEGRLQSHLSLIIPNAYL